MKKLISLDIGFDRKALPKRGSGNPEPDDRGYPQLWYGFTVPDEDPNPVALARRWHLDDGMLLTLYDLTGGEPADISLLSLSLRFQKAREQAFASPIAYAGTIAPLDPEIVEFPRFAIQKAWSYPKGHSSVFDGDFPIWNVHPPSSTSPAYPDNQLIDRQAAPRESFEVVGGGSFYYTIELRVGVVGEKVKTFRVDPEMVVDNNGGPGSGPW